MRRLRTAATVTAVLVAVGAFFFFWPEVVFDVDEAAVGSSLDDELRDPYAIYECAEKAGSRYLCATGEVGSGACCGVLIKLGEDRCWETIPDAKGRNEHLDGCIGLFDYIFDDVPCLNE